MSRRTAGAGTVTRRKDGRWAAGIRLPDGGRRWYYARTQREAQQKLDDARTALRGGQALPGLRQSVADYLAEWLAYKRRELKPRTYTRYEELVRVHLVPGIGSIKLASLSPRQLARLYAATEAAGSAPATVERIHTVIHGALKLAVAWDLIPRNPADRVHPGRVPRAELVVLDSAGARTLLAAASGHRLEALYVLALYTGMREGELLGLRWRDVNLAGAMLAVRGTLTQDAERHWVIVPDPKTTSSRRPVPLVQPAVEALRRHRVAQAAERLACPGWSDDDLVFPNRVGKPMTPQNLLRRDHYPLLARAGLPRITFHDLRHTTATLLLELGVHQTIVAELLGHATPAITQAIYSHVSPGMTGAAVAALARLLAAEGGS